MTSTSVTGFDLCLPIADRRSSMAFYREAFGFEPIGAPAEDGVPEPLQYQLGTTVMLTLIPADRLEWVLGTRALAPQGLSECLLGLTVNTETDVDDFVTRVVRAGGEVIAEPVRQDWGYTALCADLDGHAWQLTAYPAAARP